jgi:periplasmic protein CpxP/Spy
MKLAKLSLVAAMVLGGLVACSIATAQEAGKDATKGKKGFSPEQRLERMTTELSLTDAQKPKVKAVLESSQKKMQEIRDLPQDQRREKFQAMREEETKKMKEILTPEQMEKYQKMAQRGGKKGPGGEQKKEEKKSE